MIFVSGHDQSASLAENIKDNYQSNTSLKKRIILPLLLVVLLMNACSAPMEEDTTVPQSVRIMEVSEADKPLSLYFSGEVMPDETLQISFPVSGRIDQLFIRKESFVSVDMLLGKIDPLDYQIAVEGARAQLSAAQANLDRALAGALPEEIRQAEIQVEQAEASSHFARQQYDRTQSLFEAGGVSQVELDTAKLEASTAFASFQQAEQQLSQLRAGARKEEIAALTALRNAVRAEVKHLETQLNRTDLKANRSGIVADLFYEEGETYLAGTPLLFLKSEAAIIRVSVSREELRYISVGDSAQIIIDDQTTEGEVVLVSGSPDALTKTYRVDISLSQGEYVTGTIARVILEAEVAPGVAIPMSAVLAGNPDYVYVVKDGTAEWVPISIVAVEGSQLRVTGLKEGQLLVIEGMHLMTSGDPVNALGVGESP